MTGDYKKLQISIPNNTNKILKIKKIELDYENINLLASDVLEIACDKEETFEKLRDNNETITEAGSGTTVLPEVNYNPFTIEISKEGYSSYETITNISEKIDWTIALEERTWNYSQPLLMEQINNSLIGIMAIDTLGNMKIAGNLIENTNSTYINSIPNSEVKWRINDYLALTKKGTLYLLGELVEEII